MAVVTEHLVQLIAKQVDDKGLVVWYDPEQAYGQRRQNWQVKLGWHVLLTDLFAALKKGTQSLLSSVSVAQSTGGVDACVRLPRTWRNNRKHLVCVLAWCSSNLAKMG